MMMMMISESTQLLPASLALAIMQDSVGITNYSRTKKKKEKVDYKLYIKSVVILSLARALSLSRFYSFCFCSFYI